MTKRYDAKYCQANKCKPQCSRKKNKKNQEKREKNKKVFEIKEKRIEYGQKD